MNDFWANLVTRRAFLGSSIALGTSLVARRGAIAEPSRASQLPFKLGFSLYGMRDLPVADALKTCANIGYGCVELVAVDGWPCDPARLSTTQRGEIRKQLDDLSLAASAIMEDLQAVVETSRHQKNLDRLKAAAELGHAVSPNQTPVIETVLGGRPSQWDELKGKIAAALRDWAKVGETTKTVIAVKAHVGGALHTPTDAKWLIDEVASPWIRLAYDYSHFQLAGASLDESLKLLLPATAFIHVKDSEGKKENFRFLLPGDGNIDYRRYFDLLKTGGYRGSVIVEVSGQIHSKPGYDPVATARQSYAKLARHFEGG